MAKVKTETQKAMNVENILYDSGFLKGSMSATAIKPSDMVLNHDAVVFKTSFRAIVGSLGVVVFAIYILYRLLYINTSI